jgi:hypothetical protein
VKLIHPSSFTCQPIEEAWGCNNFSASRVTWLLPVPTLARRLQDAEAARATKSKVKATDHFPPRKRSVTAAENAFASLP